MNPAIRLFCALFTADEKIKVARMRACKESLVKAFIVGLIIGLILIPAGVYVYFAGGFAPVSTSSEPMPFEKMLARKGLNARVEKEAPKNVMFGLTG
jgi:hypothetical protein